MRPLRRSMRLPTAVLLFGMCVLSWPGGRLLGQAPYRLIQRMEREEFGQLPVNAQLNRVTALDDLTGDGIPELVVSVGTRFNEPGFLFVTDVANRAVRARINGTPDLSLLGSVVKRLSDLDGDGYRDFAAATSAVTTSAKVLTFSATTAGGSAPDLALSTITLPPSPQLGALISPLGDSGDFLVGSWCGALRFSGLGTKPVQTVTSTTADTLGRVVASLGDITGDGVADWVATGDREPGDQSPGYAFVFDGANLTSGLAENLALFSMQGDAPGARLGTSVLIETAANVGDVNFDGHDDIAIASRLTAATPLPRTGAVNLFDGTDGSLIYMVIDENALGLGFGIVPVGDLDGDGAGDYLTGTFGPDLLTIRSGVDGSEIARLTDGAVIPFGIGDFNGDGFEDIAAIDAQSLFVYASIPEPATALLWAAALPLVGLRPRR